MLVSHLQIDLPKPEFRVFGILYKLSVTFSVMLSSSGTLQVSLNSKFF